MGEVPTTIKKFGQEYADIERFISTHSSFTYGQLDGYVMEDITLFDVPGDEQFQDIEEELDGIIKALPSIRRIFARPLIRLRDTHETVPVEQAYVIDSYTFSHASVHSELWEDITEDGIKPRKLMAVGRTETFVLYENLVLTYVIDAVFRILVRARMLLLDALYDCTDMQFNFLDRTHHDMFFLAMGKLHMEYARAHAQPQSAYARCMEKIRFIEKSLRPRLSSALYLECKKKKGKITLKKSNAFRLHKDYREVYRLAVMLDSRKELLRDGDDNGLEKDEGYRMFCTLISVFAASHFRFSFDSQAIIAPDELDIDCAFAGWKLNMMLVKNGNRDGILYSFKKDREYRICMMIGNGGKVAYEEMKEIRENISADEYLFADPERYGEKDTVYLNLYNVDSFRRIQQMLLRGMIYSDTENSVCPFCGHTVEATEDGYECPVCRARVRKLVCPDTGKEYFISDISNYSASNDPRKNDQDTFLHDRHTEASKHFRNITPIGPDGMLLCPHCGKIHDL